MMAVTGSRVLYKLSAYDAEQVNRRREDFAEFNRKLRESPAPYPQPGDHGRSGHIGHYGNPVAEGDVYPADVVHTWGSYAAVNLQVHLDGNDCYWATSRGEGGEPGQWSWPGTVIDDAAPRAGDQVHYVSHGSPVRADGTQAYESQCRAAIVTEVPGGVEAPQVLGLCVLNPAGMFFDRSVPFDGGTFTGPEREARPGEPLPLITCDDLTFKGGTWHRAAG